nr:hypothetical protein CFP56_66813 [Quercus suber]
MKSDRRLENLAVLCKVRSPKCAVPGTQHPGTDCQYATCLSQLGTTVWSCRQMLCEQGQQQLHSLHANHYIHLDAPRPGPAVLLFRFPSTACLLLVRSIQLSFTVAKHVEYALLLRGRSKRPRHTPFPPSFLSDHSTTMHFSFRHHAAILAMASAPLLASAASTNSSSSVFVYKSPDSTTNAQFVFALSAAPSTGDLYFHMSAPAGNSWMAVGFGSQMAGALMLVAYPNSAGDSITISPRIGTGHTEPEYYEDIKCELVGAAANSNTVTSDEEHGHPYNVAMVADAVCHNATNWGSGSIQLGVQDGNTAQQMIFAVGPGLPLSSNSLTAPLHRHEFTGLFTMDLKQASSDSASVPLPNSSDAAANYTLSGATAATDAKEDGDPAPFIHGAVMSLTFIVIFPLGALLLRVFQRVLAHIIVQCIGLVLFLMATAGGIVVSQAYNRSKNFNSAHQVIGILLLLALFAQLGLGILNHRIFKKENRTTIMGKIHRFLGPGIMLFGLVNACLGFVLANMEFVLRPFLVVIILIAVVFIIIRVTLHFCAKQRAERKAARMGGQQGVAGTEGYQYPQFGDGYRPDGANMGAPPPYMHATGPQMPAFGHSAEDVQLGGLNARPGYQREVSNYSASAQVETRPMV